MTTPSRPIRPLNFPASEYVPRQPNLYPPADCVVFCKTKEAFGGLSNMAAGFPLKVNGTVIRTSEALYQSFRFPKHPEVQKAIFAQKSPMGAKMVAKANASDTRPDWDDVRVEAMWYSLQLKLRQNWESFGALLASTGDKPIVELSHKDRFWGAIPQADGTLRGYNVLGILLGALRWTAKDATCAETFIRPTSLLPGAFFLDREIVGEDL